MRKRLLLCDLCVSVVTSSPRAGIALVLVSGVLVMLALLLAAFIQVAAFREAMGKGHLASVRARTTAESGMQYAAARLAREGYPRFSSIPDDRGDDWTFRGGLVGGVEGAANPSFSHGEPWIDSGLLPGVWEEGEAFSDRDGNGRFDACSGRLRGEGDRFSLQVTSPEGKIPLNYGRLSAPDHNNQGLYAHRGLVRLLCNLGAIALPVNPAIGRIDLPGPSTGPDLEGEPILISRLGEHLVGARPEGGYRSPDEVRQVLSACGYSAAEREAILPFLDLGPYEFVDGAGRPAYMTSYDTVPYAPVSLAATPREVLRAIWLYVTLQPTEWLKGLPGMGTPYGDQVTVPKRSGGSFTFRGTDKVMIYPDEAEALADRTIVFRAGPDRASWSAFRRELVHHAHLIFARDFGMLDDGTGTIPDAHAWARAKADVAFFAATLDRPGHATLGSWMDWGIGPFAGSPPAAGVRPEDVFAVIYPNAAGNWPPNETPYRHPMGSQVINSTRIWPAGLTLAPPVRFEIASQGAAGAARETLAGSLKAVERLEFTSQEDFEQKEGGASLCARRGISIADSLPAEQRRPAFNDPVIDLPTGNPVSPVPRYPWAVTLPDWNIRGVPDAPNRKYSRHGGALALAGRSPGPQGAGEYWGFVEDFLPTVPEAEFTSTPGGISFATPSSAQDCTSWTFYGNYGGPGVSCPGLADGPGVIDACSVEMWVRSHAPGYGDFLWVTGNYVAQGMRFSSRPDVDPGLGVGCRFSLVLEGWPTLPGVPPGTVVVEGFVPNAARTVDDHLVFTLEKRGAVTLAAIYVNGGKIADNSASPFPGEIRSTAVLTGINAQGCDEIRFYDTALSIPQVKERYNLGRYVLPAPGARPSFRSPRYDLGTGGTLGLADWTGIPAGEPGGAERVGIEVWLYGYDPGGGALTGSPWRLPEAGSLADLSAIGPVRSFEYDVRFVNLDPANAAPLYRTPIFESIWFTLRRPGRAPVWTGWE